MPELTKSSGELTGHLNFLKTWVKAQTHEGPDQCPYGVRAQAPYMIWLLRPNSAVVPYLDALGNSCKYSPPAHAPIPRHTSDAGMILVLSDNGSGMRLGAVAYHAMIILAALRHPREPAKEGAHSPNVAFGHVMGHQHLRRESASRCVYACMYVCMYVCIYK